MERMRRRLIAPAAAVAAAGGVVVAGSPARSATSALPPLPGPGAVTMVSGCTATWLGFMANQPSGDLPKVSYQPPNIVIFPGAPGALAKYDGGHTAGCVV